MTTPTIGRREFVAGVASTGAHASFNVGPRPRKPSRPNIVVVVVDDMRFDEYGAGGHPFLETPHIDALARSGATFHNAYHTTPLCSPNRASILTGQYASRHGIIDNTSRAYASHRLATFTLELKRQGYETAHIGKWHMGNDPTPRPGYDHWVSFEGQGRSIDPILYENKGPVPASGYITDVLMDRAIQFATRKRTRPFMLFVAHKAIHADATQKDDGSLDLQKGASFVPAPRHAGRYAGKVFPRRPNFGMRPELRGNKPIVADALALKSSRAMQSTFPLALQDPMTSDLSIQARAEMMLAVDEGLGRLLAALEAHKLRENTMVVFMSDNGYFFGEHGLSVERRLPYEESIKCPLIVSHPAAITSGKQISEFALSIDIAPTMVDLAGADVPPRMQGRSLLPLLKAAPASWRKSFLVEYYGHDNPFPWLVNLDYRMVRFGRYKYVRWIRFDDAEELYDMQADPFEQRNLEGTAKYANVVEKGRRVMSRLVLESMDLDVTL